MRLTDLIDTDHNHYVDVDIKGITADSREVKDGWCFAALKGVKVDGYDYIDTAIQNGAKLIVTHRDYTPENSDVVVIVADDPRLNLAHMAAKFYKHQPETIVAVTGSNGKTSTVTFCKQLWQNMDYASASLGTIGIETDVNLNQNSNPKSSMTTPDPVTLHAELSELAEAGVSHLAVEASSHGLDQYRLHGLHLTAAGFTNISRDHLDYHGTMQDYFTAKAKLFTDLLPPKGIAVLNADIPEFDDLKKLHPDILDYGYNAEALKIISRKITPRGQDLQLRVLGETLNVHLPLVGEFQAYNALCALGLVIASNRGVTKLRPFEAATYLEHLKGVRGRMEHVGETIGGAHIYVDYAHTPDGLDKVLTALRPHTSEQLLVVFGCGGDRDTGKRPEMGKIAHDLADTCVVTDDNPRSEDPATIRAAVMVTCPDAKNIGDRRQAIEHSIEQLKNGDILVIAGKGHETGQTIQGITHPFDDAKVVREILKAKG